MLILVCAALSILFSWCVLKPLFAEEAGNLNEKSDRALLYDQKMRSVNMLRDLELDYSTGKLSAEEYSSIKTELSYELAEVLKKIDQSK